MVEFVNLTPHEITVYDETGKKVVTRIPPSGIGDEKTDEQEIFEEIISLLHCYSMKIYSKRYKKRLEVMLGGNQG